MEYNEGDCLLSRKFGDPATPIVFAIKPTPATDVGELFLLTTAAPPRPARRGSGTATLRPAGMVASIEWLSAP